MTATGSGPTRSSNARTVGWVLVVCVALALVAIASLDHKSNVPFDPDGTGPTGTKALVELVNSFGGEVQVPTSFPPADADIAVMFEDVVPPERIESVRRWVRDGHTLVIAEPSSELAPLAEPARDTFNEPPDQGMHRAQCDITALDNVNDITPGRSPYMFRVTPGMASCFSNGQHAFAVLTAMGNGQIVSLADPAPLVNDGLDQRDDAVLATSLLVPHQGARLAIVGPKAFGGFVSGGPGGGPSGSLSELLTAGPGLLLLELLVGGVVYALYRGRRVGKPVLEPLPVVIAGSELVGAVGNLLQRAGNPSNAGALLRADLRRELCQRTGLPPRSTPEIIAETLTQRFGLDRALTLAVLVDRPLADERSLVVLASEVDLLREAVLHPRSSDPRREEATT